MLTYSLLKLPRPALLHLHTGCYASFWRKAAYAWIGRLKGARVVIHVHPDLFAEYYDRGGPIRRRAIRATLSRASALIALRKPMAHKLAALAPGRPVHVLPNPIDLDSMTLEPPPSREPETVLFLGWYLQEKGVYDLLDAIVRLKPTRPAIRAVLGGYRDETRLRRRVEELGLAGAVTIAGWAGRDEVIRLLHTCTVFVLPSYTEGMPMVLLEAMACGAPIVTCPVGGVPDIVSEGRNALFVRPGDVVGLAAAIERILSDPSLASAMGRANLVDVRRFDVKTLLPKLLEIYSSLLPQEA